VIEHFIATKVDSSSLRSLVWKAEQSRLLAECKAWDSSLSIGDDGKADSPGHSAKYGSYALIDLKINKVIHIKLVQIQYGV